ncbi:TPA: WecB/TagA/CpsF family glycosyltransferase [Vibrio parahaemolyticus]|nr:WecB/TagA/CpsF family glycosyltransferase [Vibrio parahaemolyticus]
MQEKLDKKITCGSKFNDIISNAIENSKPLTVSFVNLFSYSEVSKNAGLVNNIDYYFSDGALLCYLHRIFNTKIVRASFDFSSIANDFFNVCINNKLKVAIVGATSEEVNLAVNNLKSLYPHLNVVYFRDGYIKERSTFMKELNDISPDVVILGMGTPHQELMAVTLKDILNKVSIIITCGGFLTQTSIKKDYYHPIVKKLGLRWLQRCYMHKHVRDRVFKEYPIQLLNYCRTHVFK